MKFSIPLGALGIAPGDDEEVIQAKRISVALIAVFAFACLGFLVALSIPSVWNAFVPMGFPIVGVLIASLLFSGVIYALYIATKAVWVVSLWSSMCCLTTSLAMLFLGGGDYYVTTWGFVSVATSVVAGMGKTLYLCQTGFLVAAFVAMTIAEPVLPWKVQVVQDRTAYHNIHVVLMVANGLVPCVVLVILVLVYKGKVVSMRALEANELSTATHVAQYIAEMSLEKAEEFIPPNPTMLQNRFLQIVRNLKRFSPFLPDYLFSEAPQDRPTESPVPNPLKVKEASIMEQSSSYIRRKEEGRKKRLLSVTSSGELPVFTRSPSNLTVRSRSSDGSGSERGSRKIFTEVLDKPCDNDLKLKKVSVVYVDVAGLNYQSQLLNSSEFISWFSSIVSSQRGSVYSFGAGWAVASWNTSSPSGEHASKALTTAWTAVSTFSETLVDMAKTCHLRVGVWTGGAHCGSVGNDKLKSFCIGGSAVERAKFLCSFTDFAQVRVLTCSENIEGNFTYKFRFVDCIHFLGEVTSTNIYTIEKEMALPQPDEWMYQYQRVKMEKDASIDKYDEAAACLLKGDLPAARAHAEASVKLHRIHSDLEDLSLVGKLSERLLSIIQADSLPTPYCRAERSPWTTFHSNRGQNTRKESDVFHRPRSLMSTPPRPAAKLGGSSHSSRGSDVVSLG